jgi:large subunit ribosomal protein L30
VQKKMGNIKITQIKSTIDRSKRQKATIDALGIKKLNQTVTKEANPQILGMVAKVAHLIKVEHC